MHSLSRRTPGRTEDDSLPRKDNLHATAKAVGIAIKSRRFGARIAHSRDRQSRSVTIAGHVLAREPPNASLTGRVLLLPARIRTG